MNQAEVDFLRDEGLAGAALADALGVPLAELEAFEGRATEKPVSGRTATAQAAREGNAARTASKLRGGRETIRGRDGREMPVPDMRLVETLESFELDSHALERLQVDPVNGKAAPSLARVTLSRGAKILRLAEAMARLQGHDWLLLTEGQRAQWTKLAERAVEALELVERDEVALAEQRRGPKVGHRESR